MIPFSPEQESIIETWNQGMAVMAGAGSGKTTTLVAKCFALIRLKPEARLAAVSFTERSAGDLRAKLAHSLGRLDSHWVTTIHGLCGSIIREYPREAGLDGEETILSETEAGFYWERVLESLWIDDLPPPVLQSLEFLLNRESRASFSALLKRTRELSSLGLFDFFEKSPDPATQALQTVSRFVLEKYTRLKRRMGYLDFGDLEVAAHRALSVESVRKTYHQRFDLVLVDEFQDTNPLQAAVITLLAKPDASNLCVVGDPKQSIYRFRDADVSVFEEFCFRLPIRKSLTWNFRSVPEIIHFTNEICEKAFQAVEMTFESLIPKRDPSPIEKPVLRLDVFSPNDVGQWILEQVEQGVPLQDFALLVRKIRGNEKWFKTLSSMGIPVAVGSGGLFWQDPRVREMVAFLKWWDHPYQNLSAAVFLRAPWVGISDLELDTWVQQDPTFRKPFFASSHPLALELNSYLGKDVRPGELLMALLTDERAEEELGAPLMGLWHRVEELSSNGQDFHSVVMELSACLKESRREREVPAPRNMGQLTVLTLHSAKGLEFPQVILIDFAIKSRSPNAPLLFWDRREGVHLGVRDENGERDRTNPLEQKWRDLEKKKNLEESMRLFYVALTRARERLILVCPEDLSGIDLQPKAEKSDELPFLRDHWRGWIDFQIPGGERIKTNSSQRRPASLFCPEQGSALRNLRKPQSREKQRPRHSVTEWNLLSRCPKAYELTYIRPVEVEVQASTASMGVKPGSSDSLETLPATLEDGSYREKFQALGNLVHEYLASYQSFGEFEKLQDLEKNTEIPEFSVKPLMDWVKNSPWMHPLIEGDPSRDVWTELPFEIPVDSEVLVGSIDRVVKEISKESEIRYFLIDFKVTEKIKSVELLLEAYQTQIELYAFALMSLDHRIQHFTIDARLVNITTRGVQIVPVELEKTRIHQLPYELAKRAHAIVNGAVGEAQTGPLCRFCEHRPVCQEGSSYYASTTSGL